MSIVALDKVTIYGPAADRGALLDALQGLGVLHLINLNGTNVRPPAEGLVSTEAREALKHLSASPVLRNPSKIARDFDPQTVIGQSLDNKRLQQSLADERDAVEKAIEELTPWGEFRRPAAGELGPSRLWFYAVPRRDEKAISSLCVPFEIAAEDPTTLYVVAISPEQPDPSPGPSIEFDPRPLSALVARRNELDEMLEDQRWRRVELTRWIDLLQSNLDEADDRAAREWAERLSRQDVELFAVQGWAPRDARDEIGRVARKHSAAATFAAPSADDQPPTLLQNPDRVAGAEGAVTFYITPAYRAWDPTPVMFVSFSLFFGMIVADAGYGLLLAAALAFFWRRLGATHNGVRFRYLLAAIVGVTIVFGTLAGSYFGLTPPAESLPGRLQVLDFSERGQMMALSICIGVSHLTLANLINAWHNRRSPRALASLGWVLLMLGALMMGAGLLKISSAAAIASAGKWLIAVGMLAILSFSSERPLASKRVGDWFGRFYDGFSALTGISKLFGDVLSYLRLFALGLASAQLAVTFNDLAGQVSQFRGLGVLLAAVILIGGHGINLVLGLMGGVVHGLRLNCIEFFNWSLTEEGTPYRSFHKKVSD